VSFTLFVARRASLPARWRTSSASPGRPAPTNSTTGDPPPPHLLSKATTRSTADPPSTRRQTMNSPRFQSQGCRGRLGTGAGIEELKRSSSSWSARLRRPSERPSHPSRAAPSRISFSARRLSSGRSRPARHRRSASASHIGVWSGSSESPNVSTSRRPASRGSKPALRSPRHSSRRSAASSFWNMPGPQAPTPPRYTIVRLK
jgi:hypothetical protein